VNWDAVLNWLGKHISWRYLLGIFATTGALLFDCDPLKVCGWTGPLRGWLLAAFIFSGAVLLSYPCSGIYKWIADYARDTRVMSVGKRHLKKLNPAEKKICETFVLTHGNPLLHNPVNGAVASLVAKRIIYPATAPWPNGMCNFNIQPWAIEYLGKHPYFGSAVTLVLQAGANSAGSLVQDTTMSPYARGYDAAIADVAAVAFAIWAYTQIYKDKLFKDWNDKLKIVGFFASVVAVHAVVSYAVLPFIHFLNALFFGRGLDEVAGTSSLAFRAAECEGHCRLGSVWKLRHVQKVQNTVSSVTPRRICSP